jgi:hypothetical protein
MQQRIFDHLVRAGEQLQQHFKGENEDSPSSTCRRYDGRSELAQNVDQLSMRG